MNRQNFERLVKSLRSTLKLSQAMPAWAFDNREYKTSLPRLGDGRDGNRHGEMILRLGEDARSYSLLPDCVKIKSTYAVNSGGHLGIVEWSVTCDYEYTEQEIFDMAKKFEKDIIKGLDKRFTLQLDISGKGMSKSTWSNIPSLSMEPFFDLIEVAEKSCAFLSNKIIEDVNVIIGTNNRYPEF